MIVHSQSDMRRPTRLTLTFSIFKMGRHRDVVYLKSRPPPDRLSQGGVEGTEVDKSVSSQEEIRDERRDRV